MASSQVFYHEGVGAWWEYEWTGTKNLVKGIGNWFAGQYDYITETPANQQWADFKRDIAKVESWEKSTAFGVTLFAGAGTAGMASKSTGMLTKIPYSTKPVVLFPTVRGGYGVFGEKGWTIKNYKIEAMYKYDTGGTVFSIQEIKPIGNKFRLDYGLEKGYPTPFLHYHFRWTIKGEIKGSTKAHPVFKRK